MCVRGPRRRWHRPDSSHLHLVDASAASPLTTAGTAHWPTPGDHSPPSRHRPAANHRQRPVTTPALPATPPCWRRLAADHRWHRPATDAREPHRHIPPPVVLSNSFTQSSPCGCARCMALLRSRRRGGRPRHLHWQWREGREEKRCVTLHRRMRLHPSRATMLHGPTHPWP